MNFNVCFEEGVYVGGHKWMKEGIPDGWEHVQIKDIALNAQHYTCS